MERTLEPELMEEADQAAAYANADFASSDELIVSAFLRALGETQAGPVVDLGCGPGNMALRLAAALPEVEILGVDGSETMLGFARARGAPFGDRVRFLHARLPTPQLPAARFGAIISNSLLHHLPEPAVLWDTVRIVGRPGAAVWIHDLRRPASPDDALALVRTYAASEPEVLQRDFLASLHAAFTVEEVQAQLDRAGLSLRAEAVGDRHLAVMGRL